MPPLQVCPLLFPVLSVRISGSTNDLLLYGIIFCRSEHWLKLHQFQCEIIRGATRLPGSKHDKASCLVCKEEAKTAEGNNNSAPPLYEMWSKVLELLPGRLAPIQDLRKALCFGVELTKQRCYGCFNDFAVEEIFWIPSLMPNNDSTTPSYTLDRFFSFCGRCDYKVAMQRYLFLFLNKPYKLLLR